MYAIRSYYAHIGNQIVNGFKAKVLDDLHHLFRFDQGIEIQTLLSKCSYNFV